MRIALGLEYLGTDFRGWQRQAHDTNTIQAYLEHALYRIAGTQINTVCAGRTDAGVHALIQVVHFDAPTERPLRAWVRGVNAFLPNTIAVRWACPVSEQFHARYSAQFRRYQYWVSYSKTRSAIMGDRVTRVYYTLNSAQMDQAATRLVGEHDFSSFRAQDCQSKTANRCIMSCRISKQSSYVVLDIKANAFLKHMVRNIMGTLLLVGQSKRSPEWVSEVLAARDRAEAGPTAPPTGLYLVEVGYSTEFGLPNSETSLIMKHFSN